MPRSARRGYALCMNSAHSKPIDFFCCGGLYPTPTNVSGYLFTDFCRVSEQIFNLFDFSMHLKKSLAETFTFDQLFDVKCFVPMKFIYYLQNDLNSELQ